MVDVEAWLKASRLRLNPARTATARQARYGRRARLVIHTNPADGP